MLRALTHFLTLVSGSFRDLAPIIVVVAFFQIVVLRQPPPDFASIAVGTLFVLVGLTLFIRGLDMALFPLGQGLAFDFARKGSLFWLLTFAFALGFGTTAAEPALIAVSAEAAAAAAQAGIVLPTEGARQEYATWLRMTVAISVGVALVIGTFRIVKGWPVHYLIIGGYMLVLAMTVIAPESIVGIAYDAGGVTTSTITVPLVTALGLGLATGIPGRSPLIDGFGLIAFASLFPMITVMGYAQASVWRRRRRHARRRRS